MYYTSYVASLSSCLYISSYFNLASDYTQPSPSTTQDYFDRSRPTNLRNYTDSVWLQYVVFAQDLLSYFYSLKSLTWLNHHLDAGRDVTVLNLQGSISWAISWDLW